MSFEGGIVFQADDQRRIFQQGEQLEQKQKRGTDDSTVINISLPPK